jgi:hypothetical protein
MYRIFGQNPLGRGREWEATSASSYTSFSAKDKGKSARSTLCSNVEFVFTSRIAAATVGLKNSILVLAFGWRSGSPLRYASYFQCWL